MTIKRYRVHVSLLVFVVLIFPFISSAKPIPSDLEELIKKSDLIVEVDVFALKTQGKSGVGEASVTVINVLLGKVIEGDITIQWEGMAVTGLGRWIAFLKLKDGKYHAAYGARSFWKVELAQIDTNECCSAFVVIRPPLDGLRIDSSLLEKQPVFINGVPSGQNPIRVQGIAVNSLERYVRRLMKGDTKNEDESR